MVSSSAFMGKRLWREWVPSSEPAVARSPCLSAASWRATAERQRRPPTVPLWESARVSGLPGSHS